MFLSKNIGDGLVDKLCKPHSGPIRKCVVVLLASLIRVIWLPVTLIGGLLLSVRFLRKPLKFMDFNKQIFLDLATGVVEIILPLAWIRYYKRFSHLSPKAAFKSTSVTQSPSTSFIPDDSSPSHSIRSQKESPLRCFIREIIKISGFFRLISNDPLLIYQIPSTELAKILLEVKALACDTSLAPMTRQNIIVAIRALLIQIHQHEHGQLPNILDYLVSLHPQDRSLAHFLWSTCYESWLGEATPQPFFQKHLHPTYTLYTGPSPTHLAIDGLANIQGVVSLLSEDEMVTVTKLYELQKILCLHFPIKDYSVPDSIEETYHFLNDQLVPLLNKGNVYLHCQGGKGRTGTIAACLMALKYKFTSAESLIIWIRKQISMSIETDAQEQFIRSFLEYVKLKKRKM